MNDQEPQTESLLLKVLKEQRKQIEENKWYLSEKAGHDVGLPFAISNWIMYHKKRFQADVANRKENGKF